MMKMMKKATRARAKRTKQAARTIISAAPGHRHRSIAGAAESKKGMRKDFLSNFERQQESFPGMAPE